MPIVGGILLIGSIITFIDWLIIEFSETYIGGILASILADCFAIGVILCCLGI